jgi:hypothetical protein
MMARRVAETERLILHTCSQKRAAWRAFVVVDDCCSIVFLDGV